MSTVMIVSQPCFCPCVIINHLLRIYVYNSGVLHGGDSDSTGTMAAAWYGTQHGFKGISHCLFVCFNNLEPNNGKDQRTSSAPVGHQWSSTRRIGGVAMDGAMMYRCK
jgi:hypothetical protein